MFMIRAFAVWLVIIAAETVHGILRGYPARTNRRRPPSPANRRPDRFALDLQRGILVYPVDCCTDETPVCRYGAALGRAYGPIRDRAGAARPRHAVEADHRRVRRDPLPLIYLAMKKNGSTLVEFFVDKIVGVLL